MQKISSPYLVSVAEQATLNLTWSEIPKTVFLMTLLICGLCTTEKQVSWVFGDNLGIILFISQ